MFLPVRQMSARERHFMAQISAEVMFEYNSNAWAQITIIQQQHSQPDTEKTKLNKHESPKWCRNIHSWFVEKSHVSRSFVTKKGKQCKLLEEKQKDSAGHISII